MNVSYILTWLIKVIEIPTAFEHLSVNFVFIKQSHKNKSVKCVTLHGLLFYYWDEIASAAIHEESGSLSLLCSVRM